LKCKLKSTFVKQIFDKLPKWFIYDKNVSVGQSIP
jgi:hypothetical protein